MDYHRKNKHKHAVLRYFEDIHFEPAQDERFTAENKIRLDQIQRDIKKILKKIPPRTKGNYYLEDVRK